MTVLQEYLEIGGLALDWPPLGDVLKVEPLYASSEVQLLSGAVMLQRGPLGGYRLTLTGSENFVVSQAVRDVVMAAWASGTGLNIVETLSNPGQRTVWPGCIPTSADFKEVAGSERTMFNFPSLIFFAGA